MRWWWLTLIFPIGVCQVLAASNDQSVWYEIRSLESNDKGVVEEYELSNATVSKFTKILWHGTPASKLLDMEQNVRVKVKLYK